MVLVIEQVAADETIQLIAVTYKPRMLHSSTKPGV
jgi:hypothetical protein